MRELIKRLSEAYGPSGREEQISSLIETEARKTADEVFKDSLGNLIVIKKGKSEGKRIMVAAHMDEIGLIITHIDDNGFLRFSGVGIKLPYALLGKRFTFPGGICATVAVEKPEDLKKLQYKKMYLDIGAKNKEEAEQMVRIGDMGVFEGTLIETRDRLSGKALDDRVGCAVLLEVLAELQTDNEICFVFTVQEELGLRGARTAAFRLNPDYALAVDVTSVGDTPEANTMAVSLGKGPTVKIKDASIICHPKVKEKMITVAEKNNIPYQLEVLVRGGTDAGSIYLTREGIPAGVMSIPCRYIHTAAEMVDLNDIANSVKFLRALLEEKWE